MTVFVKLGLYPVLPSEQVSIEGNPRETFVAHISWMYKNIFCLDQLARLGLAHLNLAWLSLAQLGSARLILVYLSVSLLHGKTVNSHVRKNR